MKRTGESPFQGEDLWQMDRNLHSKGEARGTVTEGSRSQKTQGLGGSGKHWTILNARQTVASFESGGDLLFCTVGKIFCT